MPVPKSSKSFMEASSLLQAVNVVTAGLVEDQPSPMHTKEFQTLSEFQSVNLDHETATAAGLVNIDDSEIVIQYVDVPTDIQPIVEVSCGTSKLICGFFLCFLSLFYFPMLFYRSFNPTMFGLCLFVST